MADSRLAFDILARDDGASAVFEKVARAADKTGDSMKKNSKISDQAAKSSEALTKARNNETTALDRVQVAEQKLAEVRGNSNAKTSQVLTAEKALAKARRDAAVAGNTAQKAAKELGQALDNEGKKAGNGAVKSVLHWFTGAGKDFEKAGQDAGRAGGNGILGALTGALKTPVVGPILAAGLIAAVEGVAIPAGALLAGGVVAGFGAGIAGLGLVFAAKSAAVKSAWKDSLSSMGSDMKLISRPFEQTLISMAATAHKTFQALKPDLAGAFVTLAPAVAAFGSQLGSALAKLGPALQPLAGAFKGVLGALGPALNDMFSKLSASLIKLSASVSKNPTALADFFKGVGGLTSDLLWFVKTLNDADAAFKRLTGISSVTALMYALRGAVFAVTGTIGGLALGFTKLADLTKPVGDGFHYTATSAKEAATATGYWLQGMTKAQATSVALGGAVAKSAHETHAANVAALLLADAYNRQFAATQKANQALTQMSGLLLTLSGSQIAYQQAVDDTTAAIKANGHTHDITTQKGRDNQTRLDQLAASANQQTIDLRNSNKASVAVALDAQKAYEKQAVQMHYTAAQAHALAQELINIPKKSKADFKVDISDLTSKVATAKKQLTDPHLSATKKAKLEADIVQWQAGIAAAKRSLAGLPPDKTAKLKANIADLQSKIATAKGQLADPHLTATKKAKLEATIAQLQAAVRTAQAAINSLHGTTVTNHVVTAYTTTGSRSSGSGVGGGHLAPVAPGRAVGGPVVKGQPYIVGEKRPELFVPNQSGTIIPKVPSMAVGSSIASGMAAGLRGGAGDAVSAAADVAMAVIAKAKDVLGIASPSKAFAQLGLWVNQGFSIGLRGSAKQVQSAMSSLMSKVLNISFNAADTKKAISKTITSLNASLAAARGRIKPVTGNSKQRASAERGNRQAEASIRAIQAKLKSAYTDLANVSSIAARMGTTVKRNAIIGMLQRENVAMQKLANARAVVAGQLKAAQAKLANAIQVRDDFKKQITDAALSFNSIVNISSDPGLTLAAPDILQHMQQTLAQTKAFASELASLKKLGLRDDLYKQIADAGVDGGGSTAAALLSGGSGAVKAANSLQAQIANASAGLGNTASQNLYQAGVDAAQGLVNGLLAKTKALDAASKKLADAIVAQIKKTLGIHSPSKVLEWHGSMVGHGFARGIEGEVGRVRRASMGLGNAAVPAVTSRPGARGGVIRLEIAAGDSSPYTEFLVRELRKFVRVAGGGNVQAALGVSR